MEMDGLQFFMQMQTGLWLRTWHDLSAEQTVWKRRRLNDELDREDEGDKEDAIGVGAHGSRHLKLMHPKSAEQSESRTHSCLSEAQVSSPFSLTANPDWHTQVGLCLLVTHFLLPSQSPYRRHGSMHVWDLVSQRCESEQSLFVRHDVDAAGIFVVGSRPLSGGSVLMIPHCGSGWQAMAGEPI